MNNDKEIADALRAAGLEPQSVKEIMPFIVEEESEASSALFGALWASQTPGDSQLRSLRPRNVIYNWRKLALCAVAIAGGLLVSPLTPIGFIAAGLAAIPALTEVPKITLGEDHSKVMLALWKNFPDESEIQANDLAALLDDVSAARFEEVLDDLEQLATIQRRGRNVIVKRERLLGEAR